MKAKSNVYVELQNIYKTKARKDCAEVTGIVRRRLNGSPKEIPADEIEAFCKNAAFIKLIRGSESNIDLREIASKYILKSPKSKPLTETTATEFEINPDQTLLPVYLSLKATQHSPTISQAGILSDISSQLPQPIPDTIQTRLSQVAAEVARARGMELHNISALTGGMVAQEVIKIITKQYVPVDNTCVFDGITSRSQIFRLWSEERF